MITAEDTYDVADKLLELPVHLIHPADDNVRTDLGDLDGLAASIREVGVLQPITVIPTGDEFTILMGARRHAAAQVAGLMTIPAVIRTAPLAEKRRMTMLIENVQRHDLSPLDEAVAFSELEQEYNLSQADIARRVGCSQSHVSKRVSLLTLPGAAQELVAAGELNIGDALELTRLAEHPDHVAAAIERITGDFGWDAERAVDRELDTIKVDEAIDAAKAKLDAKGIRILHTQAGYGMNAKEHAARERALAGATLIVRTDNASGFAGQKTIAFEKPAKHTSEPCHAVALVHEHTGKVTETAYCTETKRHTAKGASTLKAVKPAPRTKAVDDAVAHERKLEDEALAARERFIVEVVRNHKLDRSAIVAQVLSDYAMSGWQYNERCKTLGIDTLGRDGQIALRDYLAGGTDNVLRTCLAVLLDDIDAADPIVEGIDPLAQYGYEPTEWELAQRSNTARLDDEVIVDTIDPTVEHTPDNDDTTPDAVLCAYPGCELDDEHDGDHNPAVNDVTAPAPAGPAPDPTSTEAPETPEGAVTHPHLPDYLKMPKDRGDLEAKCCMRAEMCMHRWPDNPDVVNTQQELYRGIDEERAAELLPQLVARLEAPLTDYQCDPINGGETTCRKLIERCDPTNPRVADIQQQLYRGRVSIADAGVLRRELKKLADA